MSVATPMKKARTVPGLQSPASSRTADKFVMRLPDQMRDQIKTISRQNRRSMNSQVIEALDTHFRLIEMGHGPLLQNLLTGKSAGDVGSSVDRPALRLRVGEPAVFEGAAWIVESLEVRSNLVYAVITRENPANSMPQSKSVRLSSLTAYTE